MVMKCMQEYRILLFKNFRGYLLHQVLLMFALYFNSDSKGFFKVSRIILLFYEKQKNEFGGQLHSLLEHYVDHCKSK